MTTFPNLERARAILARSNRARAAALLAGTTSRIAIDGEITDELAASVKRKLAAAKLSGTLVVSVTTLGGDLAAAFDIFDAIRAHPAAVKITEGRGTVYSAGVLIFAAGDVRRLHADATVLLHGCEIQPDASKRWSSSRYTALAKRLQALDGGVAETIAARLGISAERVEREMQDESLTPHSRCASLNLATEIFG